MNKPQSLIVIEELLKTGKISRNYCLSKRITRLGSIINNLIAEGWKFDDVKSKEGKETMRGKFIKGDYVYFVVSIPKSYRK